MREAPESLSNLKGGHHVRGRSDSSSAIWKTVEKYGLAELSPGTMRMIESSLRNGNISLEGKSPEYFIRVKGGETWEIFLQNESKIFL